MLLFFRDSTQGQKKYFDTSDKDLNPIQRIDLCAWRIKRITLRTNLHLYQQKSKRLPILMEIYVHPGELSATADIDMFVFFGTSAVW